MHLIVGAGAEELGAARALPAQETVFMLKAVSPRRAVRTSTASWLSSAAASVLRAWERRARLRSAALVACSEVAGAVPGPE